MANPIDLCSTLDVRLYLGLPTAPVAYNGVVNTTIAVSISAGTQTVTPVDMSSIAIGSILTIDVGSLAESVLVTATTSTTFTAYFSSTHVGPNVQVIDASPQNGSLDVLLGRFITSASNYLMWRTGNASNNVISPTQSPFVQAVSYNQWYDGTGSSRLFLRNNPIVSVSLLTINGITVPPSTGWGTAGYVIDDSKKCIAFQGSGDGSRWMRGSSFYPANYRSGIWYFNKGIQNINVQYTAGYSQIPWDLQDACIRLIAFNYRRRDWQGMRQVTQPQSEGVVTYAFDWVTPPDVEEVIRRYTRRNYA